MESKQDGDEDEIHENKSESSTSHRNTSETSRKTLQEVIETLDSSHNTRKLHYSSSDIKFHKLINYGKQVTQDVDIEDEIPDTQAMTASYSEISINSDRSSIPSRPHDLPSNMCKASETPSLLNAEGYVSYEGNMTHFVAEDLEFQIKVSSPITKRGETPVFGSHSSTPSSANLFRQLMAPQIGQIDVSVLNDLEYEAQRIAQSVDGLIENLSGVLHSISSRTADNMEVYKDAVAKTCDAMDNNIRSMYTILAKGEEVSQAMRPVQAQAVRITEIKRLLHLFENNL